MGALTHIVHAWGERERESERWDHCFQIRKRKKKEKEKKRKI
jgi:hypothetical protein